MVNGFVNAERQFSGMMSSISYDERERETERETDRQRDRQTDRQTDARSHTRAHTHTHTRTHARAHARTHTHPGSTVIGQWPKVEGFCSKGCPFM